MKEENLSEQESIRLITKMIGSAKNYYYESGLSALLWGFTNVICFVLAWLDATSEKFNMPFSPFFLMIITFVIQYFFDRKERKFKATKTYLDDMNKYVWLSFAISVLILTIVGGFADIGYVVLPLLLLLFGIPTFITGCIHKFTACIVGGIICWVLCGIAFFYVSYNTYLLVAAGAAAAWVIPGFILRAKFIKNRKQHGI